MRVNKITWDKIDRVAEAGRYKCFFGYLTVTPEDVDVWKRHADPTFTLIAAAPTEESVGEDYRLGARYRCYSQRGIAEAIEFPN